MNYILFFPDELRAETLGCYGHPTIQTPAFDKLARQGVLFEQCHVQNPVCSPSRCCMMSGRYVHVSGHRTLWNLLKPYEPDLLRSMRQAGYDVRIYGKNDVYGEDEELLAADQIKTFPGAKHALRNTAAFGKQGYYDFLYEAAEGSWQEHQDARAVTEALRFLRGWKPGDKQFVIFLPLLSPHCPYTIQEPFYSMYSPDTDVVPLRGHGVGKPSFHKLIRQYRGLADPATLRKIQAVYMGMISFTDHLLGEIMDCLEDTHLADDVMLIASADHGDFAGDYGLVEKWPNAFEDVITRVPLVVRAPDCKQGHRSREQVELIDIMSTILESASLREPETHFSRSFLPQLRGFPGDPDRAVFCEGGYDPSEPHCNEGYPKPGTSFMQKPETIYYPKGLQQREHPESVCRGVMIRLSGRKLILRTNGENELYDLETDAWEMTNVYGSAAYEADRTALSERLLMWYLHTSDAVPRHEDSRQFSHAEVIECEC
jgi:arylsulfatase A-like enzyme